MPGTGALAGLRALDLTSRLGAYTGKLLADLGVDVIQVEPPGGDPARQRGPILNGRSVHWQYHNANKRSVTLDLGSESDRDTFRNLATTADFVLESGTPGWLDSLGLGYQRLSAVNNGLVMVSVTPFGQTGPHAHYLAPDIVGAAMSGVMYISGGADFPPSQPGGARGALTEMQAAVVAAVGALTALVSRDASGRGQHVDVSMQEAMAFANDNALGYLDVMGEIRRRRGGITSSTGQRNVHPCRDGWVVGSIGGRWGAFRQWIADEGLLTERWEDERWFDAGYRNANVREAEDMLRVILARHSRAEVYREAQRRRLALAPARGLDEVFADELLREREFFLTIEQPDGQIVEYPGAPSKLSATPWRIRRPAPAPGQHSEEVFAELAQRDAPAVPLAIPEPAPSAEHPLAGIRVIDFTWQAAGPLATRHLAALGAEVIKIESTRHPDGLRTTPYPRPKGNTSVNVSGIFNNMNVMKRSLTLNLGTAEGQAIIHRLIGMADVVIDNFGVDPFPRWGLSYPEVAALRPDIIMVRSSVCGRSGPGSDYIGFGFTIGPAAGINALMGAPDEPPYGTSTAHPDYSSNPHHTAFAILAALHHRNRTGEGQYIDLSQMESTVAFLGPALLEYALTGKTPERTGNRSPWSAPHGAYPCRGDDRWVAIAVETEAQWQAFAATVHEDWTAEPRFSDLSGRLTHVDALDDHVSAWTRERDAFAIMETLQAAGVPAGVVQHHGDLTTRDEHLRARGHFVTLEHPEAGRRLHDGVPFRFSATPGGITEPAPLLGEDNDWVLGSLLGLAEDEVNALYVAGILE